MPEAQQMSLPEAFETLGLSPEASETQVERAYAEKLEALEKKVAQAATAALRNKYRNAIDQLKAARETALSRDGGHDLPALSITETDDAPALGSAPPAEPAERPPTPADVAPLPSAPPSPVSSPSSSKPSLPLPLIAGAAVLVILLLGAFLFLGSGDPSAYAGVYARRVEYPRAKFDFHLTVNEDGTITGYNQAADGRSKALVITGKVDAQGNVEAASTSGTTYTGTIEDDTMNLAENLGEKVLHFTLGRGVELPSKPPQAEFAGRYQNTIQYPGGRSYQFEFNLTESGDLTGWFQWEKSDEKFTVTGRVDDFGKISASTADERTSYTGQADGETLALSETLPGGDVFNLTLRKSD